MQDYTKMICNKNKVTLDSFISQKGSKYFSIIFTEISVPFDTINNIIDDIEKLNYVYVNGEVLNGKVYLTFMANQ